MLPTLKRFSFVFIIIFSLAFFGYLVYTGMGAKTKASSSTDVAGNGEKPFSTENLVASWNFNETNGTLAQSEGSCGKQCDGQLINFAYTGSQDAALGTGWTAKNKLWGTGSLMFDGVNDLVKVNNIKDLDISGPGSRLTIELWFKTNSLSNEWQNLIFKGSSDSNDCGEPNCSNRQYTLWLHKDGFIHFTSSPQGQGTQHSINTPPGIIKIGEWYHVAATIDSTTGLMQTYVNGKLQVSVSDYSKAGIRSAGGSLSIGNRPAGDVAFNGIIDAVRIYSRALSEQEIAANFQAQSDNRKICGKEICPVGYACFQPPPPPLLPCETGKPCPVADQLPPSCRPITTPTPPQSLTATPVPSGTPNASGFLFKVRMPDVSQSVGTVKDVRVLITDKPGTLYDFKVDLQRVQGTDFFIANPIELDIPDGSYLVSIKHAKTLSRTFTIHLSKGKTLDCSKKDADTSCESLGRPELAPLYAGDSDGLVDTKTNNGVRANSYNVVDSADLQRVVAGYGLSPLPPEPNGDFNLDGKIDVQDLGILGKNFGKRGD